MIEFKLPSLGSDMDQGKLLEWRVKPGDTVKRGDVVAVVDTSKAAVDVEIWQEGTVRELVVAPGATVPVGTVLAILLAPGESTDFGTTQAVSATIRSVSAPAPAARRRISPAARRRAEELAIDVDTVTGTGPDDAVTLQDVEQAAAARAEPQDRQAEMRKAIAAAMARSWREIPHYFVSSTLDLSPMLSWLQGENARRAIPQRLHYAVPLIKAVALALKATPVLNGHYGERGFEPAAAVNLGIAVAMRGGGLIAPAILDADALDLDTLMASLNDLVARVRGGRLRGSELSASTATLTNLGEDTADALQPIIYPPQVAIIGCGQIAERPWAQDDALSARRTMTITVGGDHRVSDGRSAAAFLRRIDDLLRQPERL